MILGEIINYVAGKAGRSDDAFKAKLRTWAALRRDMLWQQQLWKDCLAIYPLTVTAGQNTVILPSQIERVLAAKTDSQSLVPVDQVVLFREDPAAWERAGAAVQFTRPAPIGVTTPPLSAGERISLVSSNNADAGKKVSIYGELAGEQVTETLALNGLTPVTTAASFSTVWQLSKEGTTGQVTATGATSTAQLVSLAPEQTEKRHHRIRLHDTPTGPVTLHVLAKRLPPPLRQDSDATGLPSLDNALLAFVTADALEGMRQYAKAASKNSEGTTLLTRAQMTEVYHDATTMQMVPASEGDDECLWQ